MKKTKGFPIIVSEIEIVEKASYKMTYVLGTIIKNIP